MSELTRAAVRKMGKAKLLAIMSEAGLPICRDYTVADCRDAVLSYIGTEYVIRIGSGFFAGDDVEPQPMASALRTSNRDEAEREAETIRRTWDVRADEVAVVEVP